MSAWRAVHPEDAALELSLRLQHIAVAWRIKSGRSMSSVEEPMIRLGTWLTDVMRLAGHEDTLVSPEAENRGQTIRVSLTVNKRQLAVYCSPKGYIEVAWSTPESSALNHGWVCDADHTIMPVEVMISMIDRLKAN